MKTLNLVRPEESEIKYKLFAFPDGEPHIELFDLDRKEDYIQVICRICNPTDLFVLMQVGDILNRNEIPFDLDIYYLMSMRMDRVISFNEAYSLKLVQQMIRIIDPGYIRVLENHSHRSLDCGRIFNADFMCNEGFGDIVKKYQGQAVFVFPDAGAMERYSSLSYTQKEIICCTKKRDISNGKLLSFNIETEHVVSESNPLLVIDDLCDGGGTFAGVAEMLRRKYPDRKLIIYVTHMVNPKGIETLSKRYDEVYFTNSYKDWDNLPQNVHMIKVV